MDDKIFTLINDKLDRLETKVDDLIEFKYIWIGRISVYAIIFAVCGTLILTYIEKALI